MIRFAALVSLVGGFGWLCLATGTVAQDPPEFADTTSVVVVEVPVNVFRDGQPVRGLKREDFEVFDGRKPQSLVGFEVVDLQALSNQSRDDVNRLGIDRREVSPVARRYFFLLFDLSYSSRPALARSLAGARDLLASSLHASDVVGVGIYGHSSGAELLLNFTPDRRQAFLVLERLQKAIDGEEGEHGDRRQDPLRLMAGSMSSLVRNISVNEAAGNELRNLVTGSRGAGLQGETLGEMNRANAAQARERGRSAFKALANSLGEFADATADIEGRKFLVYFSEGWDNDLFYRPGRSVLDRPEGGSARVSMDKMIDRFLRGGWTIQSVDAGGIDADQRLADGDGLTRMARKTGGEMYRNFNDLGSAMDEMLGKTAVTYLLSFQVEDVRKDGAFHPIKVKLRNAAKGTRVLHRAGYNAPTVDSERSVFEESLSMAETIFGGEPGGELELSVLVANFRGAAGRERVVTWLEIGGAALLEGQDSSELPLEIYAYAIHGNGEVRDFFSQTMTLDLSIVGDRLRGSHVKYFGDFMLEPGEFDLRVLVRNRETGRHALRSIELEVPASTADTARLLPPFFLDDLADGAVVIRERVSEKSGAYPFVIQENEPFVPDVAPVIGRQAGLRRVCLMGYNLGQENLLLDAGLLDAAGTDLGTERLQVVGRSETTAQGLDRLYFSLDTQGLPAGQYQLGVSLRDLDHQEVAQALMPFRIGG